MARYGRNSLTRSVSGSFGGEFVFRQVEGETVIAALPKKSKKNASAAQQQIRLNFINAALYANAATAHAGMKAEYDAIAAIKNFKSARVAAMTDYLNLPHLQLVYAQRFDGSNGFPITIVLADNYKAKEMAVSVSNKDGTLIESGNATFAFGDSAWTFTTTAPYASIEGLVVKVTVKDRIGRITIAEKVLNSPGL